MERELGRDKCLASPGLVKPAEYLSRSGTKENLPTLADDSQLLVASVDLWMDMVLPDHPLVFDDEDLDLEVDMAVLQKFVEHELPEAFANEVARLVFRSRGWMLGFLRAIEWRSGKP